MRVVCEQFAFVCIEKKICENYGGKIVCEELYGNKVTTACEYDLHETYVTHAQRLCSLLCTCAMRDNFLFLADGFGGRLYCCRTI